MKKLTDLLKARSLCCPTCDKLFNNAYSLENHLESFKKNDIYHKQFLEDNISFKDGYKKNIQIDSDKLKTYEKPVFGKTYLKKQKKKE